LAGFVELFLTCLLGCLPADWVFLMCLVEISVVFEIIVALTVGQKKWRVSIEYYTYTPTNIGYREYAKYQNLAFIQ
jgi:hypothetical protein